MLGLAIILKARNVKFDVRMWMFLATLSGLFFGVYEASTVFVPMTSKPSHATTVFEIPELLERIFVDGLQHTLWARDSGILHRPGHDCPQAATPAMGCSASRFPQSCAG